MFAANVSTLNLNICGVRIAAKNTKYSVRVTIHWLRRIAFIELEKVYSSRKRFSASGKVYGYRSAI